MSSKIGVQNIAHTNGTVAATVASDGDITASADLTVTGNTTLNGKFLIDGSNNDLMTFRTTGDTASQVLGLQFQNNSEAVTAQIFGTGDNSSSGVFRIKGIGSIELHGGDVAVSGDATNMLKVAANGDVLIGPGSFSSGAKGKQFENNNNAIALRSGSALTTTQYHNEFHNPNGAVGSISTNGSGTNFNTSSDYRLKENVNYSFDATSRLKQLKPSRFNFKTDADVTVDGFIAHEVSDVVPEAVTGEKDAVDSDKKIVPQSIDQSKLVPLLTKALQEQQATIEALTARITALESK